MAGDDTLELEKRLRELPGDLELLRRIGSNGYEFCPHATEGAGVRRAIYRNDPGDRPGPRMSAEANHPGHQLDGAVAGGLAWTASAKTATQLITWLSAVIVARLLSPADFGLVSMAGFFANLTNVLAEFGLGSAALQMPELDSDVIAQLNTISVATCTAAYGFGRVGGALDRGVLQVRSAQALSDREQSRPAGDRVPSHPDGACSRPACYTRFSTRFSA